MFAEFGSGVMVRAPGVALEKRVKELVLRALRIPRSQRGVPAETLLGELGLMPFDARSSMHTAGLGCHHGPASRCAAPRVV